MIYSDEIIDEVRARNDIVDVISQYVRLQKKGSNYMGLCPFHGEKTPSFSVSRQKQLYHCFGCGAGGSVFNFLMEYENFTFPEAVEALADRVQMTLPKIEYTGEMKKKAADKAAILEMNKEAAIYYHQLLMSRRGEQAYRYFEQRGLSKETMIAFGLGYSSKFGRDLYDLLVSKGFSHDLILKSGLATADEKNGVFDRFWNRAMFPILDGSNKVIAFGGRVMGEGKPKYLNSPETIAFDKSRNLYGLNRARQSRKSYFLLCEGYMDVISLHQAGFTNAVASLGTAFTSGHASLIGRYVKEVYLTYDSDSAGVKAALRAFPILKEAGIRAKVIDLSPYKDPDELIKAKGAEEFAARIRGASGSFRFQLLAMEQQFDLRSPEGKTAFFRAVAGQILAYDEQIERDSYVEAAARWYHIRPESLQELVVHAAISQGMGAPVGRPVHPIGKKEQKDRKKEDGVLVAQRALLTWLASSPGLYPSIRELIHPEDFTEGIYREVAAELFRQIDSTGQVDPAGILTRMSAQEGYQEIAALFHTEIQSLDTREQKEQALRDILLKIKEESINRQMLSLAPTDMQGLIRLTGEKQKLDRLAALSFVGLGESDS